jgi:hypothetical protein
MAPRLAMNTPDDDDDDGWGDEKVDITISNNTTLFTASSEDPLSSSSDNSMISKNRELDRLQNEMAMKQSKPNFDTNNDNKSSSSSRDDNKDLFIPIVTLVSIIGFTGLYGYEMARLYSRGELYLPWLNNNI